MERPEIVVNDPRVGRSLFSASGKRRRGRAQMESGRTKSAAALFGNSAAASTAAAARSGAGEHSRRRGKMFSHVSITQNADTARYLPYNSLAFPALASQSAAGRTRAPGAILPKGGHFAQMAQEQYLKDVWLSAFLDHEERTEKERTLKELAHFLRLPHGQLMPEVARRLRETNAKFEHAEKTGVPMEFKTDNSHLDVPVPPPPPPLEADFLGPIKGRKGIKGDAQAKERDKPKRRKKRKKGKRNIVGKILHKAMKEGMSIYRRENAKIKRVLKEKKPIQKQTAAMSAALDDLFELERRQTAACLVIQRTFRRYLRLCFWHSYLVKSKAATKIQRIVRGCVTREFIRRWYLRRTFLVVIAQAVYRGNVEREKVKIVRKREDIAILIMQKIVRGYLARCRAWRARSHRSATSIQRRWRGIVGRAQADRMWLDREIIKIQALSRGHLGRLKHAIRMSRWRHAAIEVQRAFRGHCGRKKRNKLMLDRQSGARQELIDMLRSEDEFRLEQIERQKKKLKKRDLSSKIRKLANQMGRKRDTVFQSEFDYVNLQRERTMVSPRAISQGWVDELDEDIKKFREQVTNDKIELLFEIQAPLRRYEEENKRRKQQIDEAEWWHRRVREWRDFELQSHFDKESKRKWDVSTKRRRLLVADQKRKWKVKFFTREGKPDKLRRPGRKWDPSAFAGPEEEQFSLGNAKLIQRTKGIWGDGAPRIGSKESMGELYDAIHLQSTMNQVQQYGALLKPLMEGMIDMDLDIHTRGGFPQARRFSQSASDSGGKGGGRRAGAVPARAATAAAGEAQVKGYDISEGADDDAIVSPRLMSPRPNSAERRRRMRKRKPYETRIPWTLLDELETEKHKLAQAKQSADSFLMNRFARKL